MLNEKWGHLGFLERGNLRKEGGGGYDLPYQLYICIYIYIYTYTYIYIYMPLYILNMPFYIQMSKNITQQRNIYDTVIFPFPFLKIFYESSIF